MSISPDVVRIPPSHESDVSLNTHRFVPQQSCDSRQFTDSSASGSGYCLGILLT
jgi:hypothetical protein